MTTLPSIRGRISRQVLLMAAACGVALLLIMGAVLHRAVDALLDDGLQESAEILYGLIDVNPEGLAVVEGILPAPPHREGVVWQLVDAKGQLALRSHQAPTQPMSAALTLGFSERPDWRIYSMPLHQDRGVLHVAQREAHRQQTQWQILGSAMGVLLVVGAALVFWLNRHLRTELRPLQDLSDAVGHYDPIMRPHDLPRPLRQELVPMVNAISGLGDRLASHVAHERAFAAHAAHALRTPLAGMDAQLAVAIRQCDPAVRGRLEQTREAATRLRNVVNALISLFRAGGEMRWQSLNLEELVGNLPLNGATLVVQAPQAIEADPDLLSAALLNLLDNAVRHHASRIEIVAHVRDGLTRLEVRDNGEGMSPARLTEVEAALRDEATPAGIGLGLTMTQLVARAHGGTVSVGLRSDSQSGVEVTLVLHRGGLAAE